jgi:hypothetical protein
MNIILKPNEKQMETLAKVSQITGVDYDGLEWGKDITPDSLIEALADMVVEYHRLEEKLEDEYKQEEPDPFKEWRDNNL